MAAAEEYLPLRTRLRSLASGRGRIFVYFVLVWTTTGGKKDFFLCFGLFTFPHLKDGKSLKVFIFTRVRIFRKSKVLN